MTGASIAIAISASGAFRTFETTVLVTEDELLESAEEGAGRGIRHARRDSSRLVADRRRESDSAQSTPLRDHKGRGRRL